MKYYQWHRPLGSVYATLVTRSTRALIAQQPRHIEFVQNHPKGDFCARIMDANLLSSVIFTQKKNQRSPRYGYVSYLFSERAYHLLEKLLKQSRARVEVFKYDKHSFYGVQIPAVFGKVHRDGKWQNPHWQDIKDDLPEKRPCFAAGEICFVNETMARAIQKAELTGFVLQTVDESEALS